MPRPSVSLPRSYVASDPPDEGAGNRPERPLLTASTEAGGRLAGAAVRVGVLRPGWREANPRASAAAAINDYWAPLLGDLAVASVNERALEVAGSEAHEIAVRTEPGADGLILRVDIVVIDRGADGYYLELATGLSSDSEIPRDDFLPELGGIVGSLVLP